MRGKIIHLSCADTCHCYYITPGNVHQSPHKQFFSFFFLSISSFLAHSTHLEKSRIANDMATFVVCACTQWKKKEAREIEIFADADHKVIIMWKFSIRFSRSFIGVVPIYLADVKLFLFSIFPFILTKKMVEDIKSPQDIHDIHRHSW